MTTLHPDLAALRARYDDLYNAALGGHISPEDARTTLESLSVTDGTGATWRIDIHGAYQRADFNGGPEAPADPNSYVGPETVHSNPETGQYNLAPNTQPVTHTTHDAGNGYTGAGLADSGTGSADGFGRGADGGFSGGFGDVADRPAHEFGSSATGGFGDDQPTGPLAGFTGFNPDGATTGATPAARTVNERPARSLKNAETRRPRRVDPAALLGLLRKHAVLIGIALVALVVIVPQLLGGHDGDQLPTSPDGTTQTTPGAGTGDPAGDDGANPAVGAPTAQQKATKQPTGDDVTRVLNALTSGDRLYLTKVVNGTPAAPQVAEAAAFYAGLKKADLKLTTGAFAPVVPGQTITTQLWRVRDGSTTLFEIPVTWELKTKVWNLSTVPVPAT